jgi:hypothetical protein
MIWYMVGFSVLLVGLAMLGLGITMLIKKSGAFPEHRVGHNKEMRKRKIYCVKTQDKAERLQYFKKQTQKSDPSFAIPGREGYMLNEQINFSNLSIAEEDI